MTGRRNVILAVVAVLSTVMCIIGQVRPAFDVVSVKTNNSGSGFVRIGVPEAQSKR